MIPICHPWYYHNEARSLLEGTPGLTGCKGYILVENLGWCWRGK